MAAEPVESATSPEAVTGGRSRARRMGVILILMAIVGVFSLRTVGESWYSFDLRPGTEVTTSQGQRIPVSAHASVSAWALVHPAATDPAAAGASTTAEQASAPGSIAGAPSTAFLFALMLVLISAGVLLRSAILSLGALMCGWYGWVELGALRSVVENPLAGAGSAFNLTRLPAQAHYQDGLALCLLFSFGLAAMVVIPKLVASAERANKLLGSLHEQGGLEALAHSAMSKVPSGLLAAAGAERERRSRDSA